MSLKLRIKDVEFANPVWAASGTFGYGKEFSKFFDINQLGAIVTKTVTLNPRAGNPPPRIIETSSGLLNSIGLENIGLERFLKEAYPFLKSLKTKVIVSVTGSSEDELIHMIKSLDHQSFPAAFEINLSCPNVKHGGGGKGLIAQDPQATTAFLKAARQSTDKLIIAKLTPNVTDIIEIAMAAEKAGADAVSLVNGFLGMAVDADSMRPLIGNVMGGLSGPAIKPLALRAVWQVFNSVNIPIIGLGGITSGRDVVEFMLCGAQAVQIGTANFISPCHSLKILSEFKTYFAKKSLESLDELVGKLKTK